ncbi:hypothetical protein ACHAP8_012079 [Fusarium lateritium]
MNISDSPLFKEFARPVLVPEPHRGRAFYSPLNIVDIFVQHLLDTAKLETTQFKISNATETYHAREAMSEWYSVQATQVQWKSVMARVSSSFEMALEKYWQS